MDGGNELIYSEKSARPPVFKMIGIILFVDFVLAILYGIAMEAPMGDMDAQMKYAPAFLIIVGFFSVFVFIQLYKRIAALNTAIEIYKDRIVYTAAKLKEKEKRVTSNSEFVSGVLGYGEVYSAMNNTKNSSQFIIITKSGDKLFFIRSKNRDVIVETVLNRIAQIN